MEKRASIYDAIGRDYNATRQADPYLAERMLALLEPAKDRLYLDIGCGTGNYTSVWAKKGFHFYGVDPSERMLNEAKTKSLDVKWLQGTAEQIPVDEAIFSGATGTLTLHHWTDLQKAFRELHRVLLPGSKAVFFTSDPEQMKGYWLNHYFPNMLRQSIEQMPAIEKLEAAATEAGFKLVAKENYFVRNDLKDLFLYCGKDRPEIYFDPAVRQGISSFTALSNAEEVKNGLQHLRDDLDSGKFAEIKSKYENDRGDYLFLVFEK